MLSQSPLALLLSPSSLPQLALLALVLFPLSPWAHSCRRSHLGLPSEANATKAAIAKDVSGIYVIYTLPVLGLAPIC